MDPDGREDVEDLPTIDFLNYDKIKKFEKSKSIVESNLDAIITELKIYNNENDLFKLIKDSANKWLKINLNSKESTSDFANQLQFMKDILSSMNSTVIKYDENTMYEGYVQLIGRKHYGSPSLSGKTLVLGWKFFAKEVKSHVITSIDREHTLVHEMSHYCFNTEDKKYGYENCLNLNSYNADNWAFFYREVFYDKKN